MGDEMRRMAVVVALLCCAVFNDSYAAEESKTSKKLDPIVVTASRVNDNWLAYPDSVSVLSATKTVDVVSSSDIEKSVARTVPDVAQVPEKSASLTFLRFR